MRAHHFSNVPALIILFGACSGPIPGDVSTADSAGVRIVTSGATDQPLPWTFTEEFRIGGADSGHGSFTSVSPASVQSQGNDRIVVLDRDRNVIELYDGSGTFLTSLGRKGSGPGEISFAIELLDLGPGRVGVFDYSKMAVVHWSPDGQVLPELRVSPEARVMRGDTAWLNTMDIDSTRTVSGVSLAVGADTMTLDSLITPPRRMTQFSCFAAMLPPMFTGRLVWDFHDGAVAATRQSEYAVDVFEGRRLTRSVRRSLAPEATTPDMARREHPEGWTVSFGNDGKCTLDPDEVAEKLGMASHLPVVTNVAFGPRGTLWVDRHVFPGEPAVTDVFDAMGAYLGTVRGLGLPLGWLDADRVLFSVEDDATGVSVIGVFRIAETQGGLSSP